MTDRSHLPPPYGELDTLYPFDEFGWFDDGKARTLARLIRTHGVETVVEIGSFLGKSTRFIAETLPEGGTVIAVDHWRGNLEHQDPERVDVYPKLATLYERFLSNVVHAGLCERIVPLRMGSLDAAQQVEQRPDLVFVDASHEYDDVQRDLAAWFPRLGPGGVLCGDDWTWGAGRPVARAVEDFAARHGLTVKTEGKIWWILK